MYRLPIIHNFVDKMRELRVYFYLHKMFTYYYSDDLRNILEIHQTLVAVIRSLFIISWKAFRKSNF